MEPLRILRLIANYNRDTAGGHKSYVAVTTEALAKRGHDIHVLSCTPGGPTEDSCQEGVYLHRRPGVNLSLGNSSLPRTGNRLFQIIAHLVEYERLGR